MKEEIVRFYEELELSLEKQIATRPGEITPGQIEAAAEIVYTYRDRVEPILLVREVRKVASKIDVAKYKGSNQLAQEAVTELQKFAKVTETLGRDVKETKEQVISFAWKFLLITLLSMWGFIAFILVTRYSDGIF